MEKIDIVIPTYNRPDFLTRILDYYDPYYKEFSFIIADSSKPLEKKKNKKIIDSHPKMNIEYLTYPPTLSQHDKFAKMAQKIKSEFCAWCADDDFLVPSGVKECVKFLKKNPDHVAVHGTYLSFYSYKKLFGENEFLWRYLFAPANNSANDPAQRVANHLSNYTLVLWGVSRTKWIKEVHKEYPKANFDPRMKPVYGELLPDCLTAAYGKIKYINTFYSARQCFYQILSFYPSLEDSKKLGIYDEEYAKFKKSIMKHVKKIGTKDLDKASKTIDDAFLKYEKGAYQEHLLGTIRSILSHTPKFVQNTFNLLHLKYLFSKPSTSKIGDISNPKSKYYKDFLWIKETVLNH